MNKTQKGVVAAGVASVLLLGGAGSLAYWTQARTVGGATINAGQFDISTPACDGWKLDGETANYSGEPVVPGDVLSNQCTFSVTAVGEHITASFTATQPQFSNSNDLALNLVPSVTYAVGPGTPVSGSAAVTVANGDVVSITLSVTLPTTVSGDTAEGLTTALDTITINATQGHQA